MSVVQSSQIILKLLLSLTNATTFGSAQDNVTQDYSSTFSNGSAAGQASEVYHAQRTLVASASEDLDLSGSLVDALGTTVAFTKLKFVLVFAAAANTNDVKVGGVNTTVTIFGALAHYILVKPGGVFLYEIPTAGGVTVTATSADLLSVTNSAGSTSVTYDIVLIGA